jgi:hypothetical protein
MTVSFPSRAHHVAALYDACKLIVDTYCNTDMFDLYEDHKLNDPYVLQATCREILNLIAEGEIK